jgi:hypothetical protein
MFSNVVWTARVMQYEMRNYRIIVSRKLVMIWEHMAIGFRKVLTPHLLEELRYIRKNHPTVLFPLTEIQIDDLQNIRKIQNSTL